MTVYGAAGLARDGGVKSTKEEGERFKRGLMYGEKGGGRVGTYGWKVKRKI